MLNLYQYQAHSSLTQAEFYSSPEPHAVYRITIRLGLCYITLSVGGLLITREYAEDRLREKDFASREEGD